MYNSFTQKADISSRELEDTQEDKKSDNGSTQIGAGYAATRSAQQSAQKAAQKFAKPETFKGNRTLYDSGSAKVNAKNKLFGEGKIVRDPYTGEKLVLTKKEAKSMYGDDWQKHLAETDHVKPLKQIHEETKNNPWLTIEDVKEGANSEDNLKVVSRLFNNPKRDRTNEKYVKNDKYLKDKGVNLTEKGKQKAIEDGKRANKSLKKQFRNDAKKNIIETGHDAGVIGAQEAGATALTMSGIMNLVSVIKGEKDSKEAIADIMKDGGKAAATGYVMGGGLTVATQSLSKASPFVHGLMSSGITGKVITAVSTIGDAVSKYASGEISTEECLIEIGDKGLNMLTMGYAAAVGQTLIPIPIVGAAIGSLVGSLLTSNYYHGLINILQTKELEHQERMRIIEECHQAAEQTKAFRKELEIYLNNYFKEYKNCFDSAISSMNFAFQAGDADGIIAGANDITRKLGGQVNYDNMKEFRDFVDDDRVDVF